MDALFLSIFFLLRILHCAIKKSSDLERKTGAKLDDSLNAGTRHSVRGLSSTRGRNKLHILRERHPNVAGFS